MYSSDPHKGHTKIPSSDDSSREMLHLSQCSVTAFLTSAGSPVFNFIRVANSSNSFFFDGAAVSVVFWCKYLANVF